LEHGLIMITATQQNTFRFLIVDDSRAIQSIVRRLLESCNYPHLEVKTASDGESALKILDDFKPDLIITDWHMPKMSGLEFCQQVQYIFNGKIPIGFVTTESSHEKLDEARRNGAIFILNKPFQDEEFTSKVLEVVPCNLEKSILINAENAIVDTNACKVMLEKYLANHEFTLTPREPIALNDLTDENLIGLYGFEGKAHPVAAVTVMDMQTVSMLWGLNKKMDKKAIKNAIVSKINTDDHIEIARSYMEDVSVLLKSPNNNKPISLTRSGIFNRNFQRLGTVLKTNVGRIDFKLEVPGLGEGLVVLILL